MPSPQTPRAFFLECENLSNLFAALGAETNLRLLAVDLFVADLGADALIAVRAVELNLGCVDRALGLNDAGGLTLTASLGVLGDNVCPCNDWYKQIEKYEDEVLSKRV